jgi:hypothetical protein
MSATLTDPGLDLIPVDAITHRIYVIRNQKVMLDSGLAELYQVPTKRLNEAVRRNRERFPADFMFQLTASETEFLRSQIATSNGGRGGRRSQPYVFTELGVAMLSSVLNSERAVQMNIVIMPTFVKLREVLVTNKNLKNDWSGSRRLSRSTRRSLPSWWTRSTP